MIARWLSRFFPAEIDMTDKSTGRATGAVVIGAGAKVSASTLKATISIWLRCPKATYVIRGDVGAIESLIAELQYAVNGAKAGEVKVTEHLTKLREQRRGASVG